MDYLQSLLGGDANDMSHIKHNRFMRIFHDLGYRIVTLSSGYTETEIRHSDRYMGPGLALTEYQNLLLTYTPIPLAARILGTRDQYDLHRDRILYALNHLAMVADDPAPTFTFAHLLIPHPPFVFDSSGGAISSDAPFSLKDGQHYFSDHLKTKYIQQYKGQVSFLNRRLLPLVHTIIRRSSKPPMIILQGDHGPGSSLDWSSIEKSDIQERMTIFHAWYAPIAGVDRPTGDMTPVNSFRTLFRDYFHLNLPNLPDRVYFSRWTSGYDFIDVTDRLAAEEAGTATAGEYPPVSIVHRRVDFRGE